MLHLLSFGPPPPPPPPPCVTETFSNAFVHVCCQGSDGNGDYQFHFHVDSSSLGNRCMVGTADITGAGNFPLNVGGNMSVTLCSATENDPFCVSLFEITDPSGNNFFNGGNCSIGGGDFQFTEGTTCGTIAAGTGTNFTFSVDDPFSGNGFVVDNSAPEVDADSGVTPLALVVGSLLLLSGGRGRKSETEAEPQ